MALGLNFASLHGTQSGCQGFAWSVPGEVLASANKDYQGYEEELDVTSRINKALSNEAFRDIALGRNYFRLLGIDRTPPTVRKAR